MELKQEWNGTETGVEWNWNTSGMELKQESNETKTGVQRNWNKTGEKEK